MTVLTFAALTLREASRRKVLRALAVLTVLLLGLSAWGFHTLVTKEFDGAQLTSGELRLIASQLLNLVMFGLSLIAALGTAFLAGPTLSGEMESGVALSIMARPIRRSTVLAGKWLGLVAFGGGFVALAGVAQFVIVYVTTGYWPTSPVTGLALLAFQTAVLLTLGLLFSTLISPMASGVVAVGLFGATWIAGVVGGVGRGLGNDSVAAVGTVSQVILPTDGLWRAAMYAFQDSTALLQFGGPAVRGGFPFLSDTPLTAAYLAWTVAWTLLVLGLAALVFRRRDL
ncbi:ABC transporter permease [Herbidospora cretacea]|uniref:ABC transporter permease n=1 Tax=Herbidospora cretacea TaxID=28444 RepID=UPI000774A77E|nr:ABC transporter permease [Herbidospora cretacea]